MSNPARTDHFIGGEWQSGGGPSFRSLSPSTGEQVSEGAYASPAQIDDAVAAAHAAFADWSRRPVEERYAVVERFSKIAADRKEEMAQLIAQEMGKALWDARTEAGAVAAKGAVSLAAFEERTPTRSDGAAHLTHRAHGPVAVLGPFNFPAHLPNGHIIPALIAGNTVVLKPSELTPAVAVLMTTWWQEAGLPDGVLNLVQGAADEATRLIKAHDIHGVFFTGGIQAGRAIHQSLGGHPEKIVALELGGNNPLVAWNVSDAKAAARVAIRSAYITAGQRCTCARRLILSDGQEGDRVVDALAALIPQIQVGPPLSVPDVFIGPLVHDKAAGAVLQAQRDWQQAGATPVVEAASLDHGPAFVSPGLVDVTALAHRKDEEVFGPLLQVLRVPRFEDAIAEANDTRFGLSAGLLSDDEALWHHFHRDVRAGIVNWNRQTTGASGKMPFGGPGLSGNHRPAGYYAADYCAWPMAGMAAPGPLADTDPIPGLDP